MSLKRVEEILTTLKENPSLIEEYYELEVYRNKKKAKEEIESALTALHKSEAFEIYTKQINKTTTAYTDECKAVKKSRDESIDKFNEKFRSWGSTEV